MIGEKYKSKEEREAEATFTVEWRGRQIINDRGEKSYRRKKVKELPKRNSLNKKDGLATLAQNLISE